MAPSSPAPSPSSNWEPSTIIELLALTLAVPGAISALVTLYMVVSRHQKKRQTQQEQEQDATLPLELELELELVHNPPAHPITTTTTALDDTASTIGLIYRFNEHLHDLHATTAERQEWEDELALTTRQARVNTDVARVV